MCVRARVISHILRTDCYNAERLPRFKGIFVVVVVWRRKRATDGRTENQTAAPRTAAASFPLHLCLLSPPALPLRFLLFFYFTTVSSRISPHPVTYHFTASRELTPSSFCRSLKHVFRAAGSTPPEPLRAGRTLVAFVLPDTSGSPRGPCAESKGTGNYLALSHQRTAWWEFLPLFSVGGLSLALYFFFSPQLRIGLECFFCVCDLI